MIDSNWVILGALIGFSGGLTYAINTLRGKTKPNLVTWFIWALAPFVAFSAEIDKGIGILALMTFMAGFSPLMVFVASFFNKKSAWRLGKMDIVCGTLSILGLILWFIFKDGDIAILFAILADLLAGIPTLIKAYFYPETENYWLYLGAIVNSSIALLTIQIWNFAHYGFPLYILLFCILAFILIKFKIGKLFK